MIRSAFKYPVQLYSLSTNNHIAMFLLSFGFAVTLSFIPNVFTAPRLSWVSVYSIVHTIVLFDAVGLPILSLICTLYEFSRIVWALN